MNASLEELRKQLDGVDRQLVALFEQRMEIARRVGQTKKAGGMAIKDVGREHQILAERASWLHNEDLAPQLRSFCQLLMDLSKQEQQEVMGQEEEPPTPLQHNMKTARVAYQGVSGAYSEEAALQFFGSEASLRPMERFKDVLIALQKNEVDYGVLPVENSITGSVAQSYDLLATYGAHVVGEVMLPIQHYLLGVPGAKLEDITHVYSHEQGLQQCDLFLEKHPQWYRMPYHNTAVSARFVATSGDVSKAAIASRHAAKRYGLSVLQSGIQNGRNNTTRFFVLGAYPMTLPGSNKMTLTFTLRNECGALLRVLSQIGDRQWNLTRIESRPIAGRSWEYRFFVDVDNAQEEQQVTQLIKRLEDVCLEYRLLGRYPAAKPIHG